MNRTSTHIRRQQATNSGPAIHLAEKLGTPLNYAITINFTLTELEENQVSRQFARVRERANRWAKQPPKKTGGTPYQPAFMWVIENTEHIGAHWLMHIPEKRMRDFRQRLPGWIEKEAGDLLSPTTIDVRNAYRPFGFRKYMLKGIDPTFAPLYRIDHVPQGIVHGKRYGVSTNIGPNQCRIHGTKKKWRRPPATIVPWEGHSVPLEGHSANL